MSSEQMEELGPRERWILRLLYAPSKGETGGPIVGKTRLMKGLFLVQKKFEDDLGRDPGFSFHPDKYGPLDPKVYDAIDNLKDLNLINQHPSEQYDGDEFELSNEGYEVAGTLFEQLSDEEQNLLIWIKSRHLYRDLDKLLSFVYTRYPKSAEKSVLKE